MISISPQQSQALVEILHAVGGELVKRWPGTAGSPALHIEYKDNGSPVTNADHLANEMLLGMLRSTFPGVALLSEEGPHDSEGSHGIWILDPLDGTKSFIAGSNDFSILLAYAFEGVPQWAGFHAPARGLTATAGRGGGAYLDGKKLQVSSVTKIRNGALYQRHCKDLIGKSIVYPQPLDSGLALLQVCQGIFDAAVIRIVNHQEWDLAAPTLLLEESGGRVSNERGELIPFGANKLECQYFVASNGWVHDEVLQLIKMPPS